MPQIASGDPVCQWDRDTRLKIKIQSDLLKLLLERFQCNAVSPANPQKVELNALTRNEVFFTSSPSASRNLKFLIYIYC